MAKGLKIKVKNIWCNRVQYILGRCIFFLGGGGRGGGRGGGGRRGVDTNDNGFAFSNGQANLTLAKKKFVKLMKFWQKIIKEEDQE